MDREELMALAAQLRDQAAEAGVYGAIIVLSQEHPPGHSSFGLAAHGRCLELEGLAARVADWATRLWVGKLSSERALPSVAVEVGGGGAASGAGQGDAVFGSAMMPGRGGAGGPGFTGTIARGGNGGAAGR